MKSRFFLAVMASFVLTALTASPAAAQAARTWVSPSGDDINPCTRRLPCLSFPGAMARTAPGGEVNCVEAGGYGGGIITKSVTIDCGGTFGSAFASVGFIIDDSRTATPGSIVVTLRNISIAGGLVATPGFVGIRFLSGRRLNVENVTIFNFAQPGANNGYGISIQNAAGTASVHVTNSVISNNGTNTSGGGIGLAPTGTGSVQLSLDHVQLTGNYRGINAAMTGTTGDSRATFVHGRIFGSTDNAINVATNANPFILVIEDVTIAGNRNGIFASGTGSATLIGGSTVTANGTAFSATGSAIIASFRNNLITYNAVNGTPLPEAPLN
jgi:hypothetical protein